MSRTISQHDVSDLAEFMRRARKENNPYVFFTGAGCSKTAGIPLSGELVEAMHKRFELELKPLNDEDRQDYGKCMAKIARNDRRKFLKKYIDEAHINWAHVALACLLKEGYISRVLTFNFDNLLARSCGLLGLYPATYDLTSANLNLYNLIDNPAIVHLHGQSHGFAQLNSEQETQNHAEQLRSFICNTLNESPTLFVGYSGQADAFFPQIKTNFSGQHRLFWADMVEQPPAHIADSILQTELAHYMCCANGSDLFLIELAQALNCFPPTIFTDPYAHLLDELGAVTDYPQQVENSRSQNENEHGDSSPRTRPQETQDILNGIKVRLNNAQQREKDENRPNFLQLFLQGKYQQIISQAGTCGELNAEENVTLARAYFKLALKQTDFLKEIEIYSDLIQRFGERTELALQEQVAGALFNKGFRLGELDRSEDAVAVYDNLIQRFAESAELALQELVARALFNKGVCLGRLDRSEDAIAMYDDLIQRFAERTELALQELVARALVTKGICLGELDRSEDAIAVYDDLIQRFAESSELALQERVVRALFNKGVSLVQLDRSEDAIAVYDDLIQRFGERTELTLQERVAKALLNKGFCLGQLDRSEDAIAVYDELIQRFGERTEPALQERVAGALNGKGFTTLMLAKAKWDDQATVQDKLNTARHDLQQALSKAVEAKHAMILGNLAYVEFLLKQPGQAEAHLREALEKGGESLYNDTLEDIAQYPVPPDTDFQALLERLWLQVKAK